MERVWRLGSLLSELITWNRQGDTACARVCHNNAEAVTTFVHFSRDIIVGVVTVLRYSEANNLALTVSIQWKAVNNDLKLCHIRYPNR